MAEIAPEIKTIIDNYSIFIKDPNTNFNVEIKSIENIIDFFQSEKLFWDSIDKNSPVINSYKSVYQTRITELNNFVTNFTSWAENTRTQQWQRLKIECERLDTSYGYRLIFSKTPHAHFLLDKYNSGDKSANYAHEYLIQYGFNLNNRESLNGYLSVIKFLEEQDKRTKNYDEYLKRSSIAIINDWVQKTFTIDHKLSSFTNELNSWKNNFETSNNSWDEERKKEIMEFINKGNIDLTKLKDSYTEKLKLEGPVTYWNQSALSFKKKGIISLISLIVISLGMIGLLLIILYNPPNTFAENILTFKPNTIKGLLVFATIVSIGLTLIRIFYKLALSSYHLQIDAEEREKLTMVYLALFDAKKVNEQERKIVLESLFSRAETGLLSGDSSPTMPGNIVNILGKN